jgi:hypothetical protein
VEGAGIAKVEEVGRAVSCLFFVFDFCFFWDSLWRVLICVPSVLVYVSFCETCAFPYVAFEVPKSDPCSLRIQVQPSFVWSQPKVSAGPVIH